MSEKKDQVDRLKKLKQLADENLISHEGYEPDRKNIEGQKRFTNCHSCGRVMQKVKTGWLCSNCGSKEIKVGGTMRIKGVVGGAFVTLIGLVIIRFGWDVGVSVASQGLILKEETFLYNTFFSGGGLIILVGFIIFLIGLLAMNFSRKKIRQ